MYSIYYNPKCIAYMIISSDYRQSSLTLTISAAIKSLADKKHEPLINDYLFSYLKRNNFIVIEETDTIEDLYVNHPELFI